MASTSKAPARRPRSTVIAASILAIIALVVTFFAVRFPGLASSEVDVSDGTVWVFNNREGLMGRLNVDAGELDGRLTSVGDDVDVLQSGYDVMEVGARGLSLINTAGMSRSGMMTELPPNSKVALGGDRVAIAGPDGRVWILNPQEAASFDPSTFKPNYEGSKPIINVTHDGTVHVLDKSQLMIFKRTEDTGKSKANKTIELGGMQGDGKEEAVELTSVGEAPVVMDRQRRLLLIGEKARAVDLGGEGVVDFERLQLQIPSSESKHVVVAAPDALIEVPLSGGGATTHTVSGTGEPVRPAQAEGCSYGAWNVSNVYVKACAGAEPVIDVVPGVESSADLVLRQNRDLVVLNDQQFGLSWLITQNMELIDQWQIEQEIQTHEELEKEKESLTTTIENTAAQRDEDNRPPVANDDDFGVRAGQSVVLPVTRNDTDPDGDVLTASLTGDQPSIGTVTAIRGGTQLQVLVNEDASGSASFTYEVNDGRGGADSAVVTLEVKKEGANAPPEQADQITPKVQVRSGREVSFNLLPYWEDPDGDPFYMADAVVVGQPDDSVSFRPDGLITFTDAGLATGEKEVQVTMRDEAGATSQGTLIVEAVDENDLPPITTADHAQIVAGRSTTIKPLTNDINPNGGRLELTFVSDSPGLNIDAALEAGTINVTASEAGTHYLEYTVAAGGGSTSSLGLVRIDVIDPDNEDLVPVAVDDLGTVIAGSETLVDPLENDVDPTGGVLVVNSVTVPEGSGLKATVVGHHLVRIEAEPNAPTPEEPVTLEYVVGNSIGTATGSIRVMITKTETQFANPVAAPDQAVVRAGDMVVVDVLKNDHSPTNSKLSLGGITEQASADERGHVEVNEDRIRFTANADATGDAVLTYEVADSTGRTGSARLSIRIVPPDVANNPPRPENLTARTVAGTPVRIPVPTTGIDPDGDSVMLMGITSPTPSLGEVTRASGEWIEYVPHEGVTGTDRFRYQVVDRHGAIGAGEILVGVAEPAAQNQPPYAVDDIVEARPGRELQISPLHNDTDPEGAPLSLVHEDVEALSEIEVLEPEEGSNLVTVMTPEEPGTHSVLYSVSDGQLKSSATITIKVDPNFPPKAPIARDDFVSAADVLDPDAEFVEVDFLANDTDPDGSVNSLTTELVDPPDGAQIIDDRVLRIPPPDDLTRVRYRITDEDDLSSYGYIWIPGRGKQGPVWVGGTIQAQDGATTKIALDDPRNVRVRPGGSPAQVTDAYLVTADHSDGGQLVEDDHTLVYRPAPGFSGRDAITVEVTDGEVGDPVAAVSTLQIPIEVASEDANLPPTLQGAVLEVEQGGNQAQLDLNAGASDPEDDELTFTMGEVSGDSSIDVTLQGGVLKANAAPNATPGSTATVPVTVTDGTNDPVSANIQVRVIASTRPLISAVQDVVTIDAGTSKTVDVLANDSNPFPGAERTITSASVTSGDGTINREGDQVVIKPDADFAGVMTGQYTVQDQTGDPGRQVSGEIRVNVRGYPDPPSAPRVGKVGDGSVELQFNAGNDNGAPITKYRVTSASGPSVSQECASTSCTITGLSNGTEYTFQVVAINDVGESKPSSPSAVARPDVRPETPSAPSAKRGDQQLTVSWSPPVNRGSAIQEYELQMRDGASGRLETVTVGGGAREHVWGGLTNGVTYSFRIRARNLSEEPSEWSDWSQGEHPAGRPGKPSGKVEASRVNNPKGGGVEVTWPAMTGPETNGEPITQYIVNSSSGKSMTVSGDRTNATFTGLNANIEHTFTVTGVNSVGTGADASNPSNAVVPWAVPSTPGSVQVSLPDKGKGNGPNGRVNVSWGAASGNGTDVDEYIVRWQGGSRRVPGNQTSVQITGLENGKSYTFTVQATNRFEGGESAPTSPSGSVTPYTKPGKPTARVLSRTCSGPNDCDIIWEVTPQGNGGLNGKVKVHYDVYGGGDYGTLSQPPYQVRANKVKSGSSVKYDFYVTVTAPDGTVMRSDSLSGTERAATYTAPRPQTKDWVWGGAAQPGDGTCDSGLCRFFGVTITGLTPGETYTITFGDEIDSDWGVKETLTADGNGQIVLPANKYYYGFPGRELWVKVDGREAGRTRMPR